MLGKQNGLTALVKKEMSHLSLDPSDVIICHCIIHQESLCALSLKLHSVMTTVVYTIDLIKSRGLNHSKTYWVILNLSMEIWFAIVSQGRR